MSLVTSEELYRTYHQQVFRYCYSVLWNKDEAEDITSQTFVTALKKLEQTAGYRDQFTWLVQIARNHIGNYWKKKHILYTLESPTGKDTEESTDWERELEDQTTPSPETIAHLAEEKAYIFEALGELNPLQREIVLLKIWEEKSNAEVAEITQTKLETVRKNYSRALAKLAEVLKGKTNRDYSALVLFSLIKEINLDKRLPTAPPANKLTNTQNMENHASNQVGTGLFASTKVLIAISAVALSFVVLGSVWWYVSRQNQSANNISPTPSTSVVQSTTPSPTTSPSVTTLPVKTYNEPRLLFVSKQDQSEIYEIWSSNLSGSNFESTNIILPKTEEPLLYQSPNGRYACMVLGTPDTEQEVYLYTVATGEIQKVSHSYFRYTKTVEGSWFQGCNWSTDSTKLAYFVSHHPQESTDGGGLVQKSYPTAYESKMGVFTYNLSDGKVTRVTAIKKDQILVDWLPKPVSQWAHVSTEFSRYQKTLPLGPWSIQYEQKDPDSVAKQLIAVQGDSHIVLYTEFGYSAPPVRLSPKGDAICYVNEKKQLIVTTLQAVTQKTTAKVFTNAVIDGEYSTFTWVDNSHILFWRSKEKTFEDNNWYQGDVFILDTTNGKVKTVSDTHNVYWQFE